MVYVIFILIVLSILLYFLFRKSNSIASAIVPKKKVKRIYTSEANPNEDGWEEIISEQKTERIAYIYGRIRAKFYGDYDFAKDSFRESFYNIHIYEAELDFDSTSNSLIPESYGIRKQDEGSYLLTPDSRFKNANPNGLICYIKDNQHNKLYQIKVFDPQIANVKFPSDLQQTEGDETFGTLEAELVGYIKDEQKHSISIWQKEVEEYVEEELRLNKTDVATGAEKIYFNRIDKEYFYDDFKTKYWKSSYKSIPTSSLLDTSGCFSFVGLLLGIGLILFLIPQAPVLIALILFGLLLRFIEPILKWVFYILGFLILIGFVVSLFYSFNQNKVVRNRIKTDDAKEVRTTKRDTLIIKRNKTTPEALRDSIIEHYRVWTDYSNHTYEGRIFTTVWDSINSSNYKNNYSTIGDQDKAYDKLLSDISINDSSSLFGVYQLFDTLKKDKSDIQFAEMIISFVQDIPYVLILDNECNASLYPQPFIKQYLNENMGDCAGNEKYGINTPVEFMSNMKGDCDTRTILLYTILKHYNYDVILLTSNIYTHSIIAINLPYEHFKLKYKFNNKQYTVCETTIKIEPGFLPDEIANMYNWRTSLKTK